MAQLFEISDANRRVVTKEELKIQSIEAFRGSVGKMVMVDTKRSNSIHRFILQVCSTLLLWTIDCWKVVDIDFEFAVRGPYLGNANRRGTWSENKSGLPVGIFDTKGRARDILHNSPFASFLGSRPRHKPHNPSQPT